MIPFIQQAITMGYTVTQILKYVSNKFKSSSQGISNARQQGYSDEEILKFLGNKIKPLNKKKADEQLSAQEKYLKSSGIKSKEERKDTRNKFLSGALGAAATGLSAYNIYKNFGNITNALGNTLGIGGTAPGSPPNPQPPLQQGPNPGIQQPQAPAQNIGQQIQQNVQAPIAQAMQPAQPNQVAQASQAIPTQQPQQNISQLLEKSGLRKHVDELSKTQKDPNVIAGLLYSKFPKEMKQFQQEAGKNMEDAVADYLRINPAQSGAITAQSSPNTENKIEPIKIEKSSIVSSPKGVGEVKLLGNGSAVVQVDGKLHKVKQEDLEPSTYTDDDVADAYDHIMKIIPEEHRSGFIQWAGYDEDRNVLGFIPRGGKYEELHNITPEEAKMIKEGKGVARTTGENREGLWVQGEDTRGGIISQIIWDRKKKKQKEDEKQLSLGIDIPKKEKLDRGMKPLFDELGYARSKSQERDKAKKLAERERKKKEKDEEKKRKKQA